MSDEGMVQWPGDADPEGPWGAEALLKWLASVGLSSSAVSIDLLPDSDRRNEPGVYDRWNLNAWRVMHAHDLYLTLWALWEADPVKADETADRVILAALEGDSYGEWLWQWATDHGLPADDICDAARVRLKVEP